MKTFETATGTVLVNDTAEDIFFMAEGLWRDLVETCLSELLSVPPSRRRAMDHPNGQAKHSSAIIKHSHYVYLIVAEHAKGNVLLSPINFTHARQERVTNRAAEQILTTTPLGRSLVHDLGAVGLFGFIERPQNANNKVTYRNTMNLILASLCAAVHGVEKIADLPPKAYSAWLRFFRNEADTRWRDALWVYGEFAFRCLREVTFAYARHTGHGAVCQGARQFRSGTSRLFWVDIERAPPDYIKPWMEFYTAWRAIRPGFAKTYRQMFLHLVHWFEDNFEPSQVADVGKFLTAQRTPSFATYLAERRTQRIEERQNRGSDRSYSMDLVTHLRYAKYFSEFIAEDIALESNGRVVYPLVSGRDIDTADNAAKSEGRHLHPAEARSRPLPMRLYQLTEEILREGEGGWPGKLGLCQEIVFEHGVQLEMYCPVLPSLFLSVFRLPARVGEMKRCDSGEGDLHSFDGIARRWAANIGPNAEYWRKSGQIPDRGYAHKFGGDPPITGFFIISFKGGRLLPPIPWEDVELHRILYELRLWQETHNPIVRPIGPELYVDGVEDVDEGKLQDYPDIFPLFRIPNDPRSGRVSRPPNGRRCDEFWQHLMAEVERRWNAAHSPEDHIQIVKRGIKGQVHGAAYNAHGLRVAGISLMFAAKVPIEIISKLLAGHKTILQTLYYIKFNIAAVHEALSEAALNRDAVMAHACMSEIKSQAFEAAQRRAAFIHEDGLRTATTMDAAAKAMWLNVGIGVCPHDGTRCHDGGPVLRNLRRSDGREGAVHGPVEGGLRNCVLCRHFFTGPAWRTPLWLFGTKLCRSFAVKGGRVGQLHEELDLLHAQQQRESDAMLLRRISRDIQERESEINALTLEEETIGKSIINVQILLEACAQAEQAARSGPEGEGGSIVLVAQEEATTVSYVETTEFEQAALLTVGSRVYPILRDEETEMARDRILDTIMWNSGGPPLTLAPLDAEEKRRGQDACARLLMEEVRREEIRALSEGTLRLQDLHLEGKVETAISTALGRPITLSAAGAARRAALLGPVT